MNADRQMTLQRKGFEAVQEEDESRVQVDEDEDKALNRVVSGSRSDSDSNHVLARSVAMH